LSAIERGSKCRKRRYLVFLPSPLPQAKERGRG
jgi:hypothetical protein